MPIKRRWNGLKSVFCGRIGLPHRFLGSFQFRSSSPISLKRSNKKRTPQLRFKMRLKPDISILIIWKDVQTYKNVWKSKPTGGHWPLPSSDLFSIVSSPKQLESGCGRQLSRSAWAKVADLYEKIVKVGGLPSSASDSKKLIGHILKKTKNQCILCELNSKYLIWGCQNELLRTKSWI